jgi:prepilin-type N-terminal cleavage/methylation domain-containing protein
MKRRARKSTIRAFTLIELMMVIAVMAILAAATGAALAEAMEQGRVSRTQAQIARIHSMLMLRYESYRTRPIRIQGTFGTPQDARQTAALRLSAIRQIMRFEMPERPLDIGTLNASGGVDPPLLAAPLTTVPALSSVYRRALTKNYATRTSRPNNNHFFVDLRNFESECLYLILSTIQDGDTNALDFLLPSEIGDTDGDGMLEVLDSWGTPVVFLRWAPGVISPLQTQLEADPFDPLRVDSNRTHPVTGAPMQTFMLVPLVASPGPDRRLGMWTRKRNPGNNELSHNYSDSTQNLFGIANDPYCFPNPTSDLPGEEYYRFGQRFVGAELTESADNIVNHFLSW